MLILPEHRVRRFCLLEPNDRKKGQPRQNEGYPPALPKADFFAELEARNRYAEDRFPSG